MTKISWATDIHFDHAKKEAIDSFVAEIQNNKSDLLFLTGDLTSNGEVNSLIHSLYAALNIPIYFVLGNHDFYGSSIEKVRQTIDPSLNYLTQRGVTTIAPGVALIGHDGWCDAVAGDYINSDVASLISDFYYIEELKDLSKEDRLKIIRRLSHQSIVHINNNLRMALKNHDHVFLLTHYPPYQEACFYEEKHSGPYWLPFFVNVTLGMLLTEIMRHNPSKKLSVYCGHTHHAAFYSPLPNISVEVGHAEYGSPEAQKPFLIDTFNLKD